MAKSIAFRIVEHLTAHGISWPGGPSNAAIYRCYVGHWQRARGAWVWMLIPKKKNASYSWPEVGSMAPAKLCARYGFEVFTDRRIGGCELYPRIHPWAKDPR